MDINVKHDNIISRLCGINELKVLVNISQLCKIIQLNIPVNISCNFLVNQ